MPLDDLDERPLYSPAEAARYADTSANTVARWRAGYTFPTRQGRGRSKPLTGGAEKGLLSFNDLLEVAVVAAARKAGVSLQAVRRAVTAARELYGVARPLSTIRFQHDGRDLFIGEVLQEQVRRYVNLSRRGQLAWEHISEVLRDLEYEGEVAVRWYPVGRDARIAIDPRISFGRPYIVNKGISTDAVRSRFKADERLADIAEDLGLTEDEAEAALRFELPAAA